jgi:hypothetical protein
MRLTLAWIVAGIWSGGCHPRTASYRGKSAVLRRLGQLDRMPNARQCSDPKLPSRSIFWRGRLGPFFTYDRGHREGP